METIKYTVDSKQLVSFDCPVCQYENCTAAYRDALIYTDTLNGICALCKTEYILVSKRK